MTPEEKTKELVDKYYQLFPLQKDVISIYGTLTWEYDNWKQAKQCALITVDEILNLLKIDLTRDSATEEVVMYASSRILYWEEVKQEIEKL